jgi:colanic acid/amylovoran biosynthesis glycosyltransferase
MKVAFIVEKFPNISETFILDEIVGAIRRGLEVDIYALTRGGASDIHPRYVEFRLAERTFYCVPPNHGRVARVLAGVPATLRLLVRKPRSLIHCARARKRGLQSRSFVALARAFVNADARYDVVHAHFGPNGVRAEVLREGEVFDAPIVTTFHGYDATSFVARNGASAYRELALHGECFIAVSESIANAIRAFGIPESRTQIMPLGVDCRTFASGPAAGEHDTVRVVSIGRFVEKKGFDVGIRAVVEARRQGARLRYEIVGDGHLRADLEGIVAQLGARDFIVFHGSKNQTEVAALLATADIMLVPSVTAASGDQEGLPIVIKEGMAMALPIVASRHAGIPEIVVHGETGLLVAERDFASLAAHLVALAGDRGERMRLGRAGRALIESKYDNETLVDELVSLYGKLIVEATTDASAFGVPQSTAAGG